MRRHNLCTALIALALGACTDSGPTTPEVNRSTTLPASTASKAPALAAAPTSLTFNALGAANAQVFTATVNFAGALTAVTSDAAVVTVSPTTTTVQKVAGDTRFAATFTVTPVGTGTATITVTDKRGDVAAVTVLVRLLLYVANAGNSTVAVYAADANGDVSPFSTIAGDQSALEGPVGLARDAAGLLYVSNSAPYPAPFHPNASVAVFAAGASGNVSPVARIAGSNTGMSGPLGIALDDGGRLYVANSSAFPSSVTIYPAGASGDVTPSATLAGDATGLNQPHGVAVDGTGALYVTSAFNNSTSSSNSVTVYAAGASGNAAPIRTIAGDNTGLNDPFGIALDGSGTLYVTNAGANSVTVYAPGASGDASPIAAIAGDNTGLDFPLGIALDPAGRLYVANEHGNSVTVYSAGANGNVSPVATIAGGSTGLSSPVFLTF